MGRHIGVETQARRRSLPEHLAFRPAFSVPHSAAPCFWFRTARGMECRRCAGTRPDDLAGSEYRKGPGGDVDGDVDRELERSIVGMRLPAFPAEYDPTRADHVKLR
jgi:hypothetical protein